MIPLSSDDTFKYNIDGIDFYFKPVIGSDEFKARQLLLSISASLSENDRLLANMKVTDDIFDMFTVDWKCSKEKIKDFPKDKKPSEMFDFEFKFKIVYTVVLKQKELSAEEKKS